MNGIMGYANAQRTLNYIRTITEFVTQADYLDLIPMFSIVNEALVSTIGKDQMTSLYACFFPSLVAKSHCLLLATFRLTI